MMTDDEKAMREIRVYEKIKLLAESGQIKGITSINKLAVQQIIKSVLGE